MDEFQNNWEVLFLRQRSFLETSQGWGGGRNGMDSSVLLVCWGLCCIFLLDFGYLTGFFGDFYHLGFICRLRWSFSGFLCLQIGIIDCRKFKGVLLAWGIVYLDIFWKWGSWLITIETIHWHKSNFILHYRRAVA